MRQFNTKYCSNKGLTLIKKENIHLTILSLLCFFLPCSLFANGLSPYSTKELEQLEKEFIQLINQSEKIERNPLAMQYINDLGKKLAHFGGIKTPYFFIVKSREINAFAGPGGYIGVNSQLILTTTNESELAGVMAHEIAHVRLHHLYSMIEHQKQMRIPMLASMLASVALGALNPTMGMGAMMASMGGLTQDSINFTRSKEKEADRIGIDMLIKAGFNPKSMATFFKKMQENSRYYYTANIPAILRTHPLDDDRIAEAEYRIAHAPHHLQQDSIEYSLFKELIRTSVMDDTHQLFNFYDHQCTKHMILEACQYGKTLAFLKNNHDQMAYDLIAPLASLHPHTLYFQMAMAQAELGLQKNNDALKRLSKLHHDFPDDYATLLAYAQGLLSTNQTEKAISILLKGSRVYKQDLPLCRELARAQAKAKKQSYAYFTQSQCLLLEGQKRAAIAQLRVAQSLAQNDTYLLARISAKVDEIKAMIDD